MSKSLLMQALAITAVLILSSACTTAYFIPDNDYVSYQTDDGVLTSTQSVANPMKSYEMYPTYEDQFVYDDEGNVIKRIETEYIDRGGENPQFIEWETSYVKIGDYIVPSTISANGVVFAEAEYEILPIEAEGGQIEFTETPNFILRKNELFSGTTNQYWSIDIADYPVSFKTDSRFVYSADQFNPYYGYSSRPVLSYGYDNIVLTRFFYSFEELSRGINMSYYSYNAMASMVARQLENTDVEFIIEWDVIADRIVQTSVEYTGRNYNGSIFFKADRGFDESGHRVSEVWQVQQLDKVESDGLITIFEQNLSY